MSLGRLTSWCFRRRRIVVPLWIVALVGVSVISAVGGADSRDNFAFPGTSSQRAYELLGERFPKDAGDSAQVVLKSDTDVTDASSKAAFEKLIGSLAHSITSPASTARMPPTISTASRPIARSRTRTCTSIRAPPKCRCPWRRSSSPR